MSGWRRSPGRSPGGDWRGDGPTATRSSRGGRSRCWERWGWASEISHGEQRQLELAIALAATPRLLLLDEPGAGLSPDETQKMVTLVRKLKGRYTIILIEHKIDVVMTMSDRISVMHFGSVIAEGNPAEIQRNPEVRRAYLGGVVAP